MTDTQPEPRERGRTLIGCRCAQIIQARRIELQNDVERQSGGVAEASARRLDEMDLLIERLAETDVLSPEQALPVEPVGAFIADELKARGWDCDELARRTGLPWEFIARHVYGEATHGFTVAQANRIGEAFGTSGTFWFNLHRQHQEAIR